MMPEVTWIKNGRLIDPSSGKDEVGDLFVSEGKVCDRPGSERLREARLVDASGLVVAPGLVDIHVHFRVPGQKHKETIRSGTAAAAAGGFTTVVCMPNTSPAVDNAGTVQLIKDLARREALVKLYPAGAITMGREGKALAPTGSLSRAGIVAISDAGRCVQNAGLMRRAVQYAHMFGIPVIDHCEDATLAADGVMNEGPVSTRLGLKGLPSAAEELVVARDVILSQHTGARIHLQHLSSRGSVDIVRRAKARGVNVTAEATPHHISLTEAELAHFEPNFKMKPPLREEEDRQALLAGLEDGTIDCIATGHAPHTDYEKDVEFDYAPFGVVGLETALSVALMELYHTRRVSLSGVLSLLSDRAAGVLKLPGGGFEPGSEADFMIFDPDEAWTPRVGGFQSKSANSPWIGRSLKGRVRSTFVSGRRVYELGQGPA